MGKPVRTHMFNGRLYKINILSPVDGITDTYKLDDRHLTIMAEPHSKAELETFIHEALHAENWAATEQVVTRVGREIGNFLWRLNYRRKT